MKKKTVYLIRHGQIKSNIDDVYAGRNGERLTVDAVREAENLGRKMQDRGISKLYSSPIARTLQTSEILNKHFHAELVVDPDLIEMDLGPWTGLSKLQVAAAYPEAFYTWIQRPSHFKMDGMETLPQIQERVVRSMRRLLHENDHDVSAVVTHAVVIKSIFLYFNGLPLDAYHNIAVSNLSVHELVFGSDRSSVKKVEQNAV